MAQTGCVEYVILAAELPAPAPDSDGTRPDLGTGRIRISL
jgi:hypothetical protein